MLSSSQSLSVMELLLDDKLLFGRFIYSFNYLTLHSDEKDCSEYLSWISFSNTGYMSDRDEFKDSSVFFYIYLAFWEFYLI